MYFVGVDLAWSYKTKEGSGIAIINGNSKSAKLTHTDAVFSNHDIANYVTDIVKDESAFIAIDAPLIVPNETGSRRAEREFSSRFAAYDAYARSSSRNNLLKNYGAVRGEELCQELENINFLHSPYIEPHERKRKIFEVYPHPAMFVLFGLNKVLPYKNKSGRSKCNRMTAFKIYQHHMKMLNEANPQLYLPDSILNINVEELTRSKLKEYEDILDAIFCAYTVYFYWNYPQRCEIFGNIEEGYILAPVFS